MIKIIIASKNKGKIREIKNIINLPFVKWLTPEDFPDWPEVEESGETYEENAVIKARAIAEKYNIPALADDSGLEVDALGGRPGVYSSRFAGEKATDADNNVKLLELMKATPEKERTARYRCWAALFIPGEGILTAEGLCEGRIGFKPEGEGGFGYDPLFYPEGYDKTMSELHINKKNQISHRAQAFRRMETKLRNYYL